VPLNFTLECDDAACVVGAQTQALPFGNNVYDDLGVFMCKRRVVRAYERFLELPVVVVLVVLWAAGVVLVGFCALVLYLCWILWRTVVGM
jgi:hypothetical protein